MDLIEIGSITIGSIIILAIIGSIAFEGIRGRRHNRISKDNNNNNNQPSKTISAIDANWNKVKIQVKPN